MPLHKHASLVSTVEHCKGLLHCDWPNTHTHTCTHGALIAPIRAQTLLPLSSALLGDLHITSLHAVTQTEACKDAHTHRKEDQTGPPQQQKKKIGGAHCVFSVTRQIVSDRDVTSILHADKPVGGGGLKWGERACVFVSVRVFKRRVVTMKWSRNRIATLHSTWPQQWWA